jgi:hypothetical protein
MKMRGKTNPNNKKRERKEKSGRVPSVSLTREIGREHT